MDQSICGTSERLAAAGESVRWTFRFDGGPTVWDWSLGAPEVRRLVPIRTPRSTEKSRHIPVQAFSVVTGSKLTLESGLEYDLVLELDRMGDAAWLVPQPARLSFRSSGSKRTRVHTPDLLQQQANSAVTIWNVRSMERQDEKFKANSEAAKRACNEVGWEYRVFAGHPAARRYNLRWLAAYRQSMPWHDTARMELREICASHHATIGSVLQAEQGAGHLTSTMWHEVWRGRIATDLNRPLTAGATLTWATDFLDE